MAKHPLAPLKPKAGASRPALSLYAREAPLLSPDEADLLNLGDSQVHAVAAARPDTPHVRALRFLNATGELLAAVALIAGTITLYGHLRPF